jgi:hypothetical protein
LPRQIAILEALHICRLIELQIALRVLELGQEAVLEDIHFVQIARAPRELRRIADIST